MGSLTAQIVFGLTMQFTMSSKRNKDLQRTSSNVALPRQQAANKFNTVKIYYFFGTEKKIGKLKN